MVIKAITLLVVFSILPMSASASGKVSVSDMAKALEIVIVDLKKQKEVMASTIASNDKNISSMMIEIGGLKEQVDSLQKENLKLIADHEKVKKQVAFMESAKPEKRRFLVEDLNNGVDLSKERLYRTTAKLKVHNEPNIESTTISYLPEGAIIEVYETNDNGVARTGIGWVSKYYLTPVMKDKE